VVEVLAEAPLRRRASGSQEVAATRRKSVGMGCRSHGGDGFLFQGPQDLGWRAGEKALTSSRRGSRRRHGHLPRPLIHAGGHALPDPEEFRFQQFLGQGGAIDGHKRSG